MGVKGSTVATQDLIGVPGARANTISGNLNNVIVAGATTIQNNQIGTTILGLSAITPYRGTLPQAIGDGAILNGPAALGLARMDMRAVAAEVSERILEEVDYFHEAANQAAFADSYRGHPFIHVPDVVAELSTRRVLTQNLVEGCAGPMPSSPSSPSAIAGARSLSASL